MLQCALKFLIDQTPSKQSSTAIWQLSGCCLHRMLQSLGIFFAFKGIKDLFYEKESLKGNLETVNISQKYWDIILLRYYTGIHLEVDCTCTSGRTVNSDIVMSGTVTGVQLAIKKENMQIWIFKFRRNICACMF